MRIALVHSFYASANPSGENSIVAEQARVLLEGGHEVAVVARHTDEESRRLLYPFESAARVASGRGASPIQELTQFTPDVVHVHNLFPNFGTHWLSQWNGPLVATLHNYRYACANAVLLRDGRWCTDCVDRGSLSAVRHGCYRGSSVASIPLALANRRGLTANPVVRRADRLVVLSATARDLFLRFGAPSDRMRMVPNAVRALHEAMTSGPDAPRFLAVGRLSAEKGFAPLVSSWPAEHPLDIIGVAAADAAAHIPAHPNVRHLGAADNAEWRMSLDSYTATVVPSVGPEGAVPLVAIESWEAGVPVVAPVGSGLARFIEDTGAGQVYDSPARLAQALADVTKSGRALRERSRSVYERFFTEHAWLRGITEVYREAISSR